jgi:hypothetical protein
MSIMMVVKNCVVETERIDEEDYFIGNRKTSPSLILFPTRALKVPPMKVKSLLR